MAVDNWDEAMFGQFYRARVSRSSEPDYNAHLTYGKRFWEVINSYGDHLGIFRKRLGFIEAAAPGMLATDRILILGCGLGFLNEAFEEAGYTNVYGIDSSPYVASKKPTDMGNGIIIVEQDFRGGNQMRTALRNATGDDEFDWVISEDLVACYTDSEIQSLASPVQTLLYSGRPTGNIIHLTTCTNPIKGDVGGLLNQNTLAEWNALIPGHTWINIWTGEAL